MTGAQCALCGSEEPLYILDLTTGQPARIHLKTNDTWAGICAQCLREAAQNILLSLHKARA